MEFLKFICGYMWHKGSISNTIATQHEDLSVKLFQEKVLVLTDPQCRSAE